GGVPRPGSSTAGFADARCTPHELWLVFDRPDLIGVGLILDAQSAFPTFEFGIALSRSDLVAETRVVGDDTWRQSLFERLREAVRVGRVQLLSAGARPDATVALDATGLEVSALRVPDRIDRPDDEIDARWRARFRADLALNQDWLAAHGLRATGYLWPAHVHVPMLEAELAPLGLGKSLLSKGTLRGRGGEIAGISMAGPDRYLTLDLWPGSGLPDLLAELRAVPRAGVLSAVQLEFSRLDGQPDRTLALLRALGVNSVIVEGDLVGVAPATMRRRLWWLKQRSGLEIGLAVGPGERCSGAGRCAPLPRRLARLARQLPLDLVLLQAATLDSRVLGAVRRYRPYARFLVVEDDALNGSTRSESGLHVLPHELHYRLVERAQAPAEALTRILDTLPLPFKARLMPRYVLHSPADLMRLARVLDRDRYDGVRSSLVLLPPHAFDLALDETLVATLAAGISLRSIPTPSSAHTGRR
ncbi:MAG: hypothetical protein KDK91_19005, partial [Gammaproteobacteria bacterium]|nr:hypothetical protein [Gammaproteobacteria bacterium]